ncbi:MAG: M15 family metallopeptidase [Acidimicrobiaceae bacterium]|nr:M15 family metallopeptidase [Acidimicrobiaceae bacterium]MCY4279528.1 M15 family metallopeptidase [Acidimicrobiaceae bacterium]
MTIRSSCHRCKSPPTLRPLILRSDAARLAGGWRHRSWLALAALLCAAAFAVPAAAQSDQEIIERNRQSVRDTEAERRALQEAAAVAAESLDAATAEAEDLLDALNRVQAAVDAQQSALDEAARAVVDAEAVVSEAEDRIEALQAELAAAQEGLRIAVIESYVSFQAPSGTFSVLGADPWQNAREEALASFATGSRIDDIDEVRRIGGELERWRLQVVAAVEEAEAQRQAQALILADLRTAVDREAELSLAAEERVERRLYEVQTIREIDASLAAEIENAERQIAAALERQRAEEEARRRAEEARRRAEEEARRRAEEDAAGRELADSVNPADPDLPLVWVAGFQVHEQIADGVEGLVAAMEAEGFDLGGWGYRTAQQQINLRRAHCGSSEWAIWSKPSRSCRPPTARPGRSNHERGLAIDITNNGRLITSRSSAAFQALSRLAPGFGLVNLPSEPWHWSVDGR